ncbi:MAG: hypothetical protein GY859_15575 [Desulfobacterales bacterium]|nr:hypothetical protein [Desulfobacterales bacterium]
MVIDEIIVEGKPKHWIRQLKPDKVELDQEEQKLYWKNNTRFYIEMFVSTTIQIISHVLTRDKSFDSLRNLEFSDASERLTGGKMDEIIGLYGPARSKKAIQSILQTIFYW